MRGKGSGMGYKYRRRVFFDILAESRIDTYSVETIKRTLQNYFSFKFWSPATRYMVRQGIANIKIGKLRKR